MQTELLSAIIDAFDGPAGLAAALQRLRPDKPISREAIYHWPNRGVPDGWHAALQEACRGKGIELSFQDLTRLAQPST